MTGLPWRATSSVAGEAPVPIRARCVLVAAWRMSDGADARRMSGLVRRLLRVLARRAPGGPPKAEPGAAPGCGGAQRSRLAFSTAKSGSARTALWSGPGPNGWHSADTKLGALRARVSSRRRFVPSAGGRGGARAGGPGLGLGRQPQSFSVLEVRLLIVLLPGFGCDVWLAAGAGRAVVPGVPGCAPAPTAPGRSSSRAAGMVCAGQAGAGRAQSRCQQVRKASFQGQSRLMARVRCRA